MHQLFLPHGSGDPVRCSDYLLGERDHTGAPRGKVRVLLGNPRLVAAIAKSLSFVERYTSGVTCWHPADEPTDRQIYAYLHDFALTAFPGMNPSQYAFSAVLHEDGHGWQDLHTFAARVDLASGKSLNMAAPGWETRFDPLRDAHNYENGWARPDDPLLARLVQPGRIAAASRSIELLNWQRREAYGLEESLTPSEMPDPDPTQPFAHAVVQGILGGTVLSRNDVIRVLGGLGEIVRTGNDFVVVRPTSKRLNLRLQGLLFRNPLDVNAVLTRLSGDAQRRSRDQPDLAAAALARSKWAEATERQAAFNRGRYQSATKPRALSNAKPYPASERSTIASIAPSENLNDRIADDSGAHAVRGTEQGATKSVGACRSGAGCESRSVSEACDAVVRAGRAVERAARTVDLTIDAILTEEASELERLAREVPLLNFASSLGYVEIEAESSPICLVMQRGDHQIAICRTEELGGLYFSISYGQGDGPIADLARRVAGERLGALCRELRSLSIPPAVSGSRGMRQTRAQQYPLPVESWRAKLLARWRRMSKTRADLERLLEHEWVIAWRARRDEIGRVVIPHYDGTGDVCGWETGGDENLPIIQAGQPGLALARLDSSSIEVLIIFSKASDAMRWARANDWTGGTALISVAGASALPHMGMLCDALREGDPRELTVHNHSGLTAEALRQLAETAPEHVSVIIDGQMPNAAEPHEHISVGLPQDRGLIDRG